MYNTSRDIIRYFSTVATEDPIAIFCMCKYIYIFKIDIVTRGPYLFVACTRHTATNLRPTTLTKLLLADLCFPVVLYPTRYAVHQNKLYVYL